MTEPLDPLPPVLASPPLEFPPPDEPPPPELPVDPEGGPLDPEPEPELDDGPELEPDDAATPELELVLAIVLPASTDNSGVLVLHPDEEAQAAAIIATANTETCARVIMNFSTSKPLGCSRCGAMLAP